MELNSNKDLKVVVKTLIQRMILNNEVTTADELKGWDETSFSSPSEFLGELKLILDKTKDIKSLDEATNLEIQNCINAIKKAFEAVGDKLN